jgi:hypothetical protein
MWREVGMSERRPFAEDAPTRRAFDRWLAALADQGVEVTAPLRYVVGAVAAAETALADAHRARMAAVKELRGPLLEAERKLNASFLAAMGKLEDATAEAGQAVEPVRLPVAVGGGSARVLPMPRLDVRARAGQGAATVRARIIAALQKAGPLTKPQLRDRVHADDQAFLRTLRALQAEGEVRTSGRGVKGHPRRYEV